MELRRSFLRARRLDLALLAAAAVLVGAAGARGEGSPLHYPVIAAAGDIACDPFDGSFNDGRGTESECGQLATSKLVLNGRYSAVLTLGDNQYDDGDYGKYLASYARSWGSLKRITRPSPGNHDYETEGASGYFRYFGTAAGPGRSGYYSFDLGSWHLVSLNSNCDEAGGCDQGSVQGRWLRRDLATHGARCTLAFWHHPRFSSGDHGDDEAVAPLWEVLYDAGADVVVTGHDHDYERFAPLDAAGVPDSRRGIREFIVGTGGRSHYRLIAPNPGSEASDSGSFGVLALTLKPRRYEWRFVSASGSYSDRGTTACH